MYIRSKPAAAFYKLAVGTLSLFLAWYILSQYGWTALRFFSVWTLLLAAVYFLSSALFLAVNRKHKSGHNSCPMLEGMIVMAFFLISGTVIAAQVNQFSLPELPTWTMIVVAGVLPIVAFLDWVLFVKKGRFNVMAPFYWLALPACYAATMIFTAELLPEATTYRYPLEMFNYLEFGLFETLLVMLIIAIVYLAVGYAWFLVDFALSGKLARKIVMIHIRTVEVEEQKEEAVKQVESPAEDKVEPEENAATAEKTNSEKEDKILDKEKAESVATETEIDLAADEALEELRGFANVEDSSVKPPSQQNENSSQLNKNQPNKKTSNNSNKNGKAMDIEVIRARVNGNKTYKKANNNPKSRNNSNNLHNSRKKKSKKRR